MRILVTRPQPDSAALAASLEAKGHEVLVAPLLEIRPLDTPIDLSGVTDLVFTSVNGVRMFAERCATARDLPVHTVGDATADMAQAYGFKRVFSANGDAATLNAQLQRTLRPETARILHACGKHRAFDLAAALREKGFAATSVALYEAHMAHAFPPYVRTALESRQLEAVLFFSPRTALSFVCLAERDGLAETCTGLVALCLSDAIAQAARALAWAEILTAPHPSRDSLLDLLNTLEPR
ncbi:uroporphyrinogen-III synthase [Limibacillus sp. MBR-115]|jgi:uroporphyrinogen-III synthase|uniref:uroporphyrinogen-III synthase n=1 Tax=Limibacillus sp. MBR-115 TaxID=3156465 RepID=UPI0033917681